MNRSLYMAVWLVLAIGCAYLSKAPDYEAGRQVCYETQTSCEGYRACVAEVAKRTGGPGPLPCAKDAGAE